MNKIQLLWFKFKLWISRKCPDCAGGGTWYGLAPHVHDLEKTGSFIGSTVIDEPETWPSNYTDTDNGAGIWTCETCNGTGKRTPIVQQRLSEIKTSD